MRTTRAPFRLDYLAAVVKQQIAAAGRLAGLESGDAAAAAHGMFLFKYPSMLQFDRERAENTLEYQNIKRLFRLKKVPCDTWMRAQLDELPMAATRPAFTKLFQLLQRGKVLEQYTFFEGKYLISLDGTGYFSSPRIHCEHCCVKEHKTGKKTYYHQILGAAMVHPAQKVVFPFAPEMITQQDGMKKNDCERNAAKRWLAHFRREHPHLPAIMLADGLAANAPFIKEIQRHNLSFILVCQDDDHQFLCDWLAAAAPEDRPEIRDTITQKGSEITRVWRWMRDVPLNGQVDAPHVNVVEYEEHSGDTLKRHWRWVTDLDTNANTIKKLCEGGRCRWKIENETFNTLKNGGYHFEHNYGHGHKNLSNVLACLMVLAFFCDQITQHLNVLYHAAYNTYRCRRVVFEKMRGALGFCLVSSLEDVLQVLTKPPNPVAAA